MNISNLTRQHEEIRACMDNVLNYISKNNLADSAADIAKELNMLAGKLKIHLISENDFLYPDLLKSSNLKVKELAEAYMDEMTSIGDKFMKYKDNYNTKTKIESNVDAFIRDTKETFQLLEVRLNKEDKELYPKL
ncbi:MAG: hemerythrin domain-containing protein [Tissierellia bacterium]|nr:hemerythrin domain-containing protein [Tissierellia bacterium]